MSVFSFTQFPNYYTIGEDELANSDIYSTLYDEKSEILYAASSRGVYKYVANEFSPLNATSEQVGSALFSLQQNSKGELFCFNFSGQIFKIVDDSLEIFFDTDAQFDKKSEFYINENDDIVYVKSNAILLIDGNGESTDLLELNGIQKDVFNLFSSNQLSSGEIYIFSNQGGYFLLNDTNLLKFDLIAESDYYMAHEVENELYVFNVDGEVFLKPKEITIGINLFDNHYYKKFQGRSISLNQTNGINHLFVDHDSLKRHLILENQFVSCLSYNDMGTAFLGSFKEGIRVVPKLFQTSFEMEDELILDIVSINDSLAYVCTRSGKVLKLEKNNPPALIDQYAVNIDHVFYEPNFARCFNSTLVDKNLRYKEGVVYRKYSHGFTGIIEKSPTAFFLWISKDIFYCTFENNVFKKNKLCHVDQQITNLTYDKGTGTILTSTNSETFFFNETSVNERNNLTHNNDFFGSNDMLFAYGVFIVATEKHGVLFYEKEKLLFAINEQSGLNSNSVKKIAKKDDLLFILSLGELQLFNLKTQQFIPLGRASGMGNGNVISFSVSDNEIWITEKGKVYTVSIDDVIEPYLIKAVHMDSILINGRLWNGTTAEFSYDQNDFSFFFDYRNFETKTEVQLNYKLEGFNDHWKSVNGLTNDLVFESLYPKDYKFRIKAVYGDQESKEYNFSFTIKPPFWKQWWFYLLIGIITFFLTYLFFRRRLTRQKIKSNELIEKEQLSTNLAESQLKALRAQMNPHFIFNSLNSIQSLILKQDTDKSYDYISQFAELVRMSLNHSEKEFVLLQKEIEFLEIYLGLEALRFGEDFSFTIHNRINDPEIAIPSLLIQPFIENALLHGLLHKKGVKTLKITFSLEEKLICIIEDNGIGRTHAKEIKKRQGAAHESFSTKAIKRRLEILSTKLKQASYFQYEDVIENGMISGTKVIIVVPFAGAS